jgi:SMI1/KNR4 family protein SUKH-1
MTADWLETLQGVDYRWDVRPLPATEQDIAALGVFVARPLPDDYVAFLRHHDGGALWYRDVWYIHLWRASDIPEWSSAYGFSAAAIPGAIPIGSDGASECLALDIRPQHSNGNYPICAINFVSIDWDEALPVAPDFRSLLLLRHALLER